MNNTPVRARFAPSPTGHLHIGGLRTALFNYLFAKNKKGTYLLRIEDTDFARSTEEFKKSILDSFAWIEIQPDEPVVIQSERLAEHNRIVKKLIEEKKAYFCYCSPDDLALRLGKGQEDVFVRYDRYCFKKEFDKNDLQREHVVRFVMPENDLEIYSFDDLIRDTVTFEPEQFDDFIIVRSDGIPVYNFVVVIDDAFMKITHVIRGEEHIPNTPKQIALYKACGYQTPQFAHLPMILGPGGNKLSKRDGAKSVYEYKNEGYLPHALVNYLARLGWSHGDQEIFSKEELIQAFNLEHVGKKGAIFDPEKLNWMNGHYIRSSSASYLYHYIETALDSQFFSIMNQWSSDVFEKAIELFKGRVFTLIQLMNSLSELYYGVTKEQLKGIEIPLTDSILTVLKKIQHTLHNELWTTSLLKEVATENALRMIEITQPLRIALLGKSDGPGINDIIQIIGMKEGAKRLALLLEMHE
jgi:glutamyl-tRNA synthetase